VAASSNPASKGRDLSVEAAPFVGERYRARRPIEESHADARLKPCHGAADAGGRQPERFGRPHEIAGFHNRGQNADAAE
jgi:hypothetical protein